MTFPTNISFTYIFMIFAHYTFVRGNIDRHYFLTLAGRQFCTPSYRTPLPPSCCPSKILSSTAKFKVDWWRIGRFGFVQWFFSIPISELWLSSWGSFVLKATGFGWVLWLAAIQKGELAFFGVSWLCSPKNLFCKVFPDVSFSNSKASYTSIVAALKKLVFLQRKHTQLQMFS